MLSLKNSVCNNGKNNYGVKRRNESCCGDIIPASRLQLIEDIKLDIRNGKNVLIIGEAGSGKTYIIKKLSKNVVEYPTWKRILKKVGKGSTISEMLENAKGMVFIDNIDELNNLKYLKELSKKVQIVATAKKEIKKDIFKIHKIKKLSNFEAYAFARRRGKSKKEAKKIAEMCGGNFEHLVKLINSETQRPYFRKVNLLPNEAIPIVAFALIVLKYHSYIHSAFELGYLFATFGYSLLIIEKIRKSFS